MLPSDPSCWQSRYKAADPALWTGREEADGHYYWHQWVECCDLRQHSIQQQLISFIGFAVDTGVARNHGRVGAAAGPDAIRQQLAKLCVNDLGSCQDLGSIECQDGDLNSSQTALAMLVKQTLAQNAFPVVLGGGHETAFGHYQGIAEHFSLQPVAIINLDAHYDLRPALANQQQHSGSGFRQIAEYLAKEKKSFDYCCVGLQRTANNQSMCRYADDLGVTSIWREQFIQDKTQSLAALQQFIDRHERIYLTVCLDVLAASIAPGVSAPQPFGLTATELLEIGLLIAKSNKVVSLDIVELAPPLDFDQHTAALAAQFIWHFLHNR